MWERGSLCAVGSSTSGRPHHCCLHTDVKLCLSVHMLKNVCRSLNPVGQHLLLFCHDDVLHTEIETGTVSPAIKVLNAAHFDGHGRPHAKPLTDSDRQDLFVILRDFSGLTQVLIPQEEVRTARRAIRVTSLLSYDQIVSEFALNCV